MSAKSDTPAFKAITINGAITVESRQDAAQRAERRKDRKSRWDGSRSQEPVVKKTGSILLSPEPAAVSSHATMGGARPGFHAAPTKLTTLSTMIDASSMSEKEQLIYILQLQIQEASHKLALPGYGIPKDPRERSPSPEPIYNTHGIRINTRDERTKQHWLNQRNLAITKLTAIDPTYKPPAAYKYKNSDLEDRVDIPADEHPHINFMGLLLGPRGKTLEELNKKTNCQIVVRGKGTLKSGMTGILKSGIRIQDEHEPMHAVVRGQKAEDVKRAVKEIEDLINVQIYHPDSERAVAIRAKNMHELAIMNGTLRDIDLKCLNCGKWGHNAWECKETSSFTSSVICSACGGVGHITSDCRQNRPGSSFNIKKGDKDAKEIDQEYSHFLKDMGLNPEDVIKREKKECTPRLGALAQGSAPRMLTQGGCAPGAASAEARAVSTGQLAGGRLAVLGKSIFGGNLTRMTAGFKSQAELEIEKKQKIEEFNNRPIPIEWKAEQLEKRMNHHQGEYMKQLEAQKRLLEQNARFQTRKFAPPPPPPGHPTSLQSSTNDLPNLERGSICWFPK